MDTDDFLNPKPLKEKLQRLEALIHAIYYNGDGSHSVISEMLNLAKGLLGKPSMKTSELERIVPRYLNSKQEAAKNRNFREIQRLVFGLKSEINSRRQTIERGGNSVQ